MDAHQEGHRSHTLRGWTHRHEDAEEINQPWKDENGGIIHGRVVKETPTGSYTQELELMVAGDESTTTYTIQLDAEKHHKLQPWMALKGARKLLCVGVSLQVDGILLQNTKDDNNNHKNVMEATRILLTGALPATPYLARLLAYPPATLALFFDTDEDYFVPLAGALRPCSVKEVQRLCQLCLEETAKGRFPLLFKHVELQNLCSQIRNAQGWARGPDKLPTTSPQTWSALLRMEQRWCQDVVIQEEEEVVVAAETTTTISIECGGDRVVFNGVDVDPSLNLPDPTDPRRLQYIEERKRPQVLWMLGLIERLVLKTEDTIIKDNNDDDDDGNNDVMIRLVDIGGGRGDLANAVAAYFNSQPQEQRKRRKVHVYCLDVNPSSLDAGRQRAEAAKIGSFMSFHDCDLANHDQVDQFLTQNKPIHVVFGLHCCGGLADAAVELALRCRAKFAISTCCFRSHPHLSSLSQFADTMIVVDENENNEMKQQAVEERHRSDRNLTSTLAVIGGAQGQPRAVRALNAMRLAAAQERFQRIHHDDNGGGGPLRTWQESFPVQYSEQNCVMVGVPS
jgi:hypothetical protein